MHNIFNVMSSLSFLRGQVTSFTTHTHLRQLHCNSKLPISVNWSAYGRASPLYLNGAFEQKPIRGVVCVCVCVW